MADVILFFDAFWGLMWFPLFNLFLENILISCPALLLIICMVFEFLFIIFREAVA